MNHLRFCMLYSAYSKEKENTGYIKRLASMHPQTAMKELGITYQHSTPQSIAEQWWFWNCENIPDKLPPFLSYLDIDPMEVVGLGLSEQKAIDIVEYSNKKEKNKSNNP